LTIASIVILVQ